jgi:uncharacterized phage protein (TIGR01671 family)
MKELKFRVWDDKKEKMLVVENMYFFGTDKWGDDIWEAYDDEEDLDLLPHAPIMQYTGVKDKNGKEIYEEDILLMRYHGGISFVEKEKKGLVCFDRGAFAVKLDDAIIPLRMINDRSLEVIGNDYENIWLLNPLHINRKEEREMENETNL